MALPEPKAGVQRLFNRLSGPYARVVFSRLERETQADVAWVRPRAGEKVLDLACGPGTQALELVGYGCRVYAVDLAEQMIARAQVARRRRRCPPVHFAVADVEQLPLPGDEAAPRRPRRSEPGGSAVGVAQPEIGRAHV